MRASISPSVAASSIALVTLLFTNDGILHASAFTSQSSPQAFSSSPSSFTRLFPTQINKGACKTTNIYSTINAETISSNGATSPSPQLVEQFLSQYEQSLEEGYAWANEFGFTENEGEQAAEGAFYSIFRAIRTLDSQSSSDEKVLGLDGTPFYIPAALLAEAEGNNSDVDGKNKFSDYFHFPHLATALEEDFLDAQRGSTDNRKGWQVAAVSQPTGSSFDDARMTLDQVKTALEVSKM